MNSLFVIHPYLWNRSWVFDDAERGLTKEPFVQGIPEMIQHFTTHLHNPWEGFELVFSASPFPNSQGVLERSNFEFGGAWYTVSGMAGWLCPALLKYFPDGAPEQIHFTCKQKESDK